MGSDLQTMDSWFISTAGPCGRCSFFSPRHMQIPTVPPLSLHNCRLFCNRRRPICVCACVCLCVCVCVRSLCSRQGPALFQGINKRCRVLLKGPGRRKTQTGRIWRDCFENLGRAWRCIDSPFEFHRVQTHCIVGHRLCCLGVPQVRCKKPAPHLPDRFVQAGPESFGRERQVGMDRQTD